MAKFAGAIGYANTEEEEPGVYVEKITERPCTGDLLRVSRRITEGDSINPDLSFTNAVSIVADAYHMANFQNIRYVKYRNQYFTATSVEVDPPRLTIRMGAVYNGSKAEPAQPAP